MVKISDVARRVAEKDGQDWEHLPDLMKMEYHMQVERVFQAASELGDEQAAARGED